MAIYSPLHRLQYRLELPAYRPKEQVKLLEGKIDRKAGLPVFDTLSVDSGPLDHFRKRDALLLFLARGGGT